LRSAEVTGADRPVRDRYRLTLVLDPRFPGGTAASVAAEIAALAGHVDLRVVGLETAMLTGRAINPRLGAVLESHGLAIDWQPPVIRGDSVVVHNPACLKFETVLAPRISCDRLYVVTHENFLRPNGAEAFDVGHCLDLLARRSVAGRRILAPVSPGNRRGVAQWLAAAGDPAWALAAEDWSNICDFEMRPPRPAPRDRRGRHSRPGPEKFPPLATMTAHFPAGAERCAIMGADAFLRHRESLPAHWEALPFGALAVEDFLEGIDFFVYFTNPLWRESFGRVIAEAIAAGKVVITDPATAETFGAGVVASDGRDVDQVIADLVAAPDRYGRLVREGQDALARFAPAAARARILREIGVIGDEGVVSAEHARHRALGSGHALL
jgi:hypothetical protein